MYLVGIIELEPNDGGEEMMSQQSELLWVVVEVQSGIPVEVKAYRNKRSAVRREQFLRKRMRPDYDEVSIFEVEVRTRSPR